MAMRVAMIGTGYVGLVSGACFADFGHNVICLDKDQDKIDLLNKGGIPIYEPGLNRLVERNMKEGRLSFITDLHEAVKEAEVIFIAVGTPSRRGDGLADLSYVYDAAKDIADAMTSHAVIVTKSTVPVGTGDAVEKIIRERGPNNDFWVVSNPEFLREGAAIEDFKRPDRIVIGANDEHARQIMRELYRPLYLNETPMIFTNRQTSELIKYAANSFLATKITFINEIADLCEKVGANVQQVAKGIGLDGRIGSKFLHAGPGFGGSCFPKDALALVRTAEQFGVPIKIVETAIAVNEERKVKMADKIVQALDDDVQGKTVAILGLTFKPNTDDMREAPSLTIIPYLQARGAVIKAHDPEGMREAAKLLNDVTFFDNPYECMKGADGLVILTEWNRYRALDLINVKELLKTPKLIDLRNIYNPNDMDAYGIDYTSIGR